VTSIGYYAFSDCRKLTSISISDSVTSIGYAAFDECESLTSIAIPNSVTTIEDITFQNCKSLTSITIPNSVTSIRKRAFTGCESLTNITIPNSVISIGDYVFNDCYSLTSVSIPKSVTNIGNWAFLGCYSLEAINISDDNPNYTSKDGILYTRDMKTLLECPGAKTGVTIPDSVKSIESGAFAECKNLTSITIPNSVTSIGVETEFGGCGPFACAGAFFMCESLTSVTIPNSVTSMGDFAFIDCSSLTNITIPNSVTSIGKGAFSGCSSLTSITIPNSVTSIDWEAFLDCDSLTSIVIPNSVTKIGERAFENCSNLTIYCELSSYAESYLKELGIPFVAFEPAPTVTPTPTSAPAPTAAPRISLSKCKITLKPQVYTGKALKPAVKVVLDKKTLKSGTDYTVSYKNNKAIGTATVTVTGKGSYTGTKKASFKINPKAVTGLKLTEGKGLINAGWKKSADGVDGYQLQYSLKKSFSGAKKVTVAKAATVKKVLKGLTTGKTYYVRIRAFKKVGKNTYYSAWSAAKTAKVK